MNKSIHLSLKAGERLYLNGAVIRVSRKVTLELMNDASFLLEGHVMQVEETTTPLRQLYFIAQTILMDPRNAGEARKLFAHLHARAMATFMSGAVVDGLRALPGLIEDGRVFDALRTIRSLLPVEDGILAGRLARAA